jgi:hypothetical protein
LYAQNRQNCENSIILAIKRLANCLRTSSAVDSLAPIVVLRAFLPVVVTNANHAKLFRRSVNNGDNLSIFLPVLLGKLLFYPGFTIPRKPFKWYDSPLADESRFDQNRLMVTELLLLLKQVGADFSTFDFAPIVSALSNALTYYLSSPVHRTMTAVAQLFQPCFLLLLSSDNLVKDQIFDSIVSGRDHPFSGPEYEIVILPILLNLIKLATTDEQIISSAGLSLILNSLHCVDVVRHKKKFGIAMFCLAAISSFPSVCIGLNEPCTSFESDIPVHRGSYADVLVEIVTRGATSSSMKISVLVLSAVIPYASNLSYSSAVSIFRLLETLFNGNNGECVNMIVAAVHFVINRSIRENVPLVIVLMKNSRLVMNILKANPGFEECEQLVSLAKNINQELKQLGNKVKSSDLEKFFDDPSCEHFALPVLRPPQIDFDFGAQVNHQILSLCSLYITNEIGVVPPEKHQEK